MSMMKRIFTLLLLLAIGLQASAKAPRLVVQLVVSSMRAGDLERYEDNLSEGGFKRLLYGGHYFPYSRYDYQQTTTPVALATLTTGAMPSMHGVIGESWFDYTDNSLVRLTAGRRGEGGYHLVAPTLAESMRHHDAQSRTVSLALDATSAIVMGGREGDIFWIDPASGEWTTSLYYTQSIPEWVARSNREGYNLSYLLPDWRTILPKEQYRNTRHDDIHLTVETRRKGAQTVRRIQPQTAGEKLCYTPAGNSVVIGMAKQAIAQFELGKDQTTDLLNICFDASRYITQAYGPESIEAEDALYRLDKELADFLTFLFAQVEEEDCLVILTSDHGTSSSYDLKEEQLTDRFNAQQFRVIVNGFLNVRYGTGTWVLGYHDQSLYLNHNLIYERNLNLEEVQNEVAIFAQQFSGVSHAVAASAFRSSYFSNGYARRMQNSFYPRRSGDVILNLIPGQIEERDLVRSASGSMYGYDTQVPLIFYGNRIGANRTNREVSMTSVAPTVARLAEVAVPEASEGAPIEELMR